MRPQPDIVNAEEEVEVCPSAVDDEDRVKVNAHKWFFDDITGYWRRTSDGLTLHMFLMGEAPYGSYWDHIDCDKTNNRKSNLRLATPSQSQANKPKISKKTSSQYKGVHKHTKHNRWIAQIKVNGKQYHLGSFVNEEDAARKYDWAAKEIFGEYARTNF